MRRLLPLLLLAAAGALRAQSPSVLAETGLYLDRSQFDDAQRALNRGLAQQPNQPTYLTLQGLIHMRRGDYARAEEAFARAADNSPGNSASHLNLGEVLYLRGKYAEALKQYQRVEKDADAKPFASYKEVLCLLLTGRTDEADRLALEIPQTEKDPAFYYAVAATHFARGNRDRANYFLESARRTYDASSGVFRIPLVQLGWTE